MTNDDRTPPPEAGSSPHLVSPDTLDPEDSSHRQHVPAHNQQPENRRLGVPLGQLAPGVIFAGYRIEHVLGHGGMGTVYVAAHPRLPRRDVLKLLSPSFSNDPNFRARFEREADLAGSLEHRNIVSVYDRGSENGQLWIAMRYVRGYDASTLITDHPGGIDPAFAVHIITEIGNALDHAHRRGMVHRDVKPANILIESDDDDGIGGITLTDFGIARAVDDAMHLTDTGLTVASVPYASPEQLHGYELDGRADIYALAATFVELLTGQPPFPRDNRLAAMSAHLHDEPPTVSQRVQSLPYELDDVIRAALAKDPNDRYATCAEFTRAAAVSIGLAPGPAPQSGALRTTAFGADNPQPDDQTARITRPRNPTSVVSDPRFHGVPNAGSSRVFAPAGNPDNPTQLVSGLPASGQPGSGQQARSRPTTPAPGSRKKTTLLISLATILALVGVIAGALAYVKRTPDAGSWDSAHQSIAGTFPSLLPAGPNASGWNDSSCSATTSAGLNAIVCNADSGLKYTVWGAPTPQARAVVAQAVGNQPGTQRIWSEGPVHVSADTVPNGWVITNFTDAQRSPYTIVATWPGHPGQQVLDDWWRNAPFDS